MKFRVFIGFVFFVCSLVSGICLAQNKVVVIPLMSDCNVIPTVTSAGQVWMDRNLGAAKVYGGPLDWGAWGWLYQWGRLPDGHEVWRIGANTTNVLSSGDVPGHQFFIIAPVDPNDWRQGQNPNLWQGVSGVNNPCPRGFRLPTRAEWETEVNSWVTRDTDGARTSALKLPPAGIRLHNDGSVSGGSNQGYYWSSTVTGTRSDCMWFTEFEAVVVAGACERATGLSVRCIKD